MKVSEWRRGSMQKVIDHSALPLVNHLSAMAVPRPSGRGIRKHLSILRYKSVLD